MHHEFDPLVKILFLFSAKPFFIEDVKEQYKFEISEEIFNNNIGIIKTRKYIALSDRKDGSYEITEKGKEYLSEYFDKFIKDGADKEVKKKVEAETAFTNLRILKMEEKVKTPKDKLTIDNLWLQKWAKILWLPITIIALVLGLIVNHYKPNLIQYLPKIPVTKEQKDETYPKSKANEITYHTNKQADSTQ